MMRFSTGEKAPEQPMPISAASNNARASNNRVPANKNGNTLNGSISKNTTSRVANNSASGMNGGSDARARPAGNNGKKAARNSASAANTRGNAAHSLNRAMVNYDPYSDNRVRSSKAVRNDDRASAAFSRNNGGAEMHRLRANGAMADANAARANSKASRQVALKSIIRALEAAVETLRDVGDM